MACADGRTGNFNEGGGYDARRLPGARSFVYTPGANNSLSVLVTNPLGRQTTYTFVNGLVTSATGTGGAHVPDASMSHSYDANGYDRQVTDWNGNVTVYSYAANGQLQQKVEASGQPEARTTNYVWDGTAGTNRLLKVIVVGDHETDYTYDPATQRVATVSTINLTAHGIAKQTHTTTFMYSNNSSNGMLAQMVADGPVSGPSDAVTTTYTTAGDLASVANNLGQTTTYGGYNAFGEPATVTGPNGNTTAYTYNLWGEVTSTQTTPNGVAATTSYYYDGQGRLANVITPDGVSEHYVYDDAQHLIAKYRAANGSIAGGAGLEEEDYTYNAANEVIEVDETARTGVWKFACSAWWVDGEGVRECAEFGYGFQGTSTLVSKAMRSYDGLGRVWTVGGNNGQNFVTGYDNDGNVVSSTDSLGHVTTSTYDHLNRKTSSTDPKSGVTAFGYDGGDRVVSVVDPRLLITTYVYDGFGQLWAQSSPDTGTVSFTYDAGGRRTGFTRADGTITSYGFDSLNRVATISAGGKTQTFTYDACANGKGRLCTVADAFNGYNDSLSTTYTPEGWVASQSSVVAGSTYNTSYAYDSMGRATGVTYPNGVAANYAYAAGKLASATVTINGATQNIATGLTYEPYAGVADWTYGNGLVRTNDYDLDGRLIGIGTTDPSSPSPLQSLTFGYDANNSITAITNAANVNLSQTFNYDALTRLTGVAFGSSSTTAWAYDADSNRSSQTVGSASSAYSLASGNNTLAGITGTGARTFGYDVNGNRISDSGTSGAIVFHYDPFNRMDTATKGGTTTTYHVDPQGRRVYKSSGGSVWTHFVYGIDGTLLGENGAAGMTDYLWMGGQPVALVRNNTLYMVHTDQLGRPEIVTNAAKAVVWRASNYAFDRTVTLDTIGGLNLGFPGQYYDAETGLWNNGFRDYDASVGRYVESDPLGLDAGVNTFGYVGGEPTAMSDPMGLTPSLSVNHNLPMGPVPYNYSTLYQAPDGQYFYAPATANFNDVRSAGQSDGTSGAYANIWQFGTYDFQRLGASSSDGGTFWSEWTNASNFAVGVYMNGAGFSESMMDSIGTYAADLMSSDAGSPNLITWWNNGWIAASLGRLSPALDQDPNLECKAPWANAKTLPSITAVAIPVAIPFAGDYTLLNGGSVFSEAASIQDLYSAYPSPANDTRSHKN